MESCVLPVHKIWWKIRGNKTSALGAIIQLHERFTSAGDQIWVCDDGRQQRPLYHKSRAKRELATVTRLRDPLQPFVFLPAPLMGDFDFPIKVGTVGNSGIISPLSYSPMSVKMALNISQDFIMFLPVFIPPTFLSRSPCSSHWGKFIPSERMVTLRACHDLNSSKNILKTHGTFVFFPSTKVKYNKHRLPDYHRR